MLILVRSLTGVLVTAAAGAEVGAALQMALDASGWLQAVFRSWLQAGCRWPLMLQAIASMLVGYLAEACWTS
jgi:hypothetical protein